MNVFLALPGSGKMMSPFFLLTFSDLDTMSKLTLYCMVMPIGITPKKNRKKIIIAVELTIKHF